MKYMLWYSAKPGRQDELQAWLIGHFAETALNWTPRVAGLRVNAAVPEPSGLELYGSNETNSADVYDAIVEITCSGEGVAKQLLMVNEPVAESLIQHCHVYEVEEEEVINRLESTSGLPSQGYKLMRGLFFYPDLPDSAVRRSWKHHQQLAVRVHTGLARYACIWVNRPLTPGAPPIQGVSVLHFPSVEDMQENYFDSPRGRNEIIHDIGHFISRGTSRVFTKEFSYAADKTRDQGEPWSLWPLS